MLVDVRLGPLDRDIAMILGIIGRGNPMPVRLQKGVYQIPHFSFGTMLPRGQWEEYPNLSHLAVKGYVSEYGVCDSPEQFMSALGAQLEADSGEYVVSLTCIERADQPSEGGWRWHKWGPYIGLHEREHEYLYDEKMIDRVWCYHIFEKKA